MAIQMSKILFIWPPKLEDNVSVFRHMIHFGETIGYLTNLPQFDVSVMDGAVNNHFLKDFAKEYSKDYDVIAMQIEPHNIEEGINATRLAKGINPRSKIITFGTACCINPNFFIRQDPIDSVCYDGNYEYAIKGYAERKPIREELTDVLLKENGKVIKTPRRNLIPPNEWAYPPWKLLPLDKYKKAHHENEGRIGVSRGCVFGCNFCKQTYTMGTEERYRDVDDVIKHLRDIRDMFDVFSVAATNFGYNRNWAEEFCEKNINGKLRIKWNTMSRVEFLDEELIKQMARSGCYKIGFGVETLNPETQKRIGKIIPEEKIKKAIKEMKKYNIIPRACIMIGMPGQTREEIVYTMTELKELGASIRAKEYYPYEELKDPNLTWDTIRKFNRTDYYHNPIPQLSKEEFLKIIFFNQIC